MVLAVKNGLILFLGMLVIASCNFRDSKKRQALSQAGLLDPIPFRGPWPLTTSSNYIFDSEFVDISSGKASLLPVNQTFETQTEFDKGSYSGVVVTVDTLTLGSNGGCDGLATNCSELNQGWAPQVDNLIGQWSLNEAAAQNGTVVTQGVGQPGVLITNNGATDKTVQGKMGNAFNFDGDLDYLEVPFYAALGFGASNFSVSAWVKLSSTPTAFFRYIGTWDGGAADRSWGIGVSTDLKPRINLITDGANSLQVRGEQVLTLNKWYHIVTVRESGSVRMYVDGKAVTVAVTATAGTITSVTESEPLYIGASDNDGVDDFHGVIDEIGVWNVSLTDAEAEAIFDMQYPQYSGNYTSKVIDRGTSTSWTNLDWVTSLPYGKELTGSSGNELVSDYITLVDSFGNIGNGALSDNLLGLWHFNEFNWTGTAGEVLDSSGRATHGEAKNGLTTQLFGAFDRSGNFDGVDDYIELPVMNYTDNFTISMWFRTDNVAGTEVFLAKKTVFNMDSVQIFHVGDDITARVYSADDVSIGRIANNVLNDELNHLVVMYSGGFDPSGVSIYLNGVKVDDTDEVIGVFTTFNDLALVTEVGSQNTGMQNFSGMIDELAIWSRNLHPNEIANLYRRGVNKVKFQVRSCNDSACDGENWRGPDGTSSTFYSELHNCASADLLDTVCNGARTINSPSLSFADFSSPVLSNRYFQWRAYLESHDRGSTCAGGTTCRPEVSKVEIGPTSTFYAGSPAITNIFPATATTFSGFTAAEAGTCSITYQISADGVNFYYWNGFSWTLTTLSSQSNPATTINSFISFFGTQIGGSLFYWRAFLNSDGTQNCELDQVNLSI